jgi:two-component system chemotaxis sensor kinase CheA
VKNLTRKAEAGLGGDEAMASLVKDFNRVDEEMAFVSSNIQDEMTKVRLIPIAHLFNLFPRAMRDLAHEKKKDVELRMEGEETHLDKAIIDEMKDPIMHILRNCVDHGIESPEEREKHHKPPSGTIRMKAFQVGSQVAIEISDDGGGIDILKVKEKAAAKGLVARDKVDEVTDEQVYQFLFLPGFSTKEEVTETSGRGVGLDVVRDTLSRLKGTIEIVSARHAGTTFLIKLPLTLAITEVLLASAGSDIFAMPIDAVVETIRIELGGIKSVETREAITVRGQIMPIVRLADIFALPPKGIVERRYFPVVIVQAVEKKIGILVDSLEGRLNIVSKVLGDPVRHIKFISGATILGDGKAILILDIPMIIDSFETGAVTIKRQTLAPAPAGAGTPAKRRRKTILLAEDAMTTAMLEKSILESAGFSVVLAKDGQEALEKSQQEKFDLVITDVLMPRMDGFDLTATLKKDKLYKDIPIIIVTTRESDADKRHGLEAGADAYILKSEFTSEGLLNTIERLIG